MVEPGPTTADVDRAVLGRCLAVLRQRPAGLMTDIDGTISQMAPTPHAAVVAPAARAALARLAGELALVGVVTGRSAQTGEEMVQVPGLVYVGNHGMERRLNGAAWHHPEAAASAEAITAALAEIARGAEAAGLREYLVIEDKRLSGSIHYRLAPDAAAARQTLWPLAEEAAHRHGLKVTGGRLIVELRPPITVSKGTALTALADAYHLRGLVFCGDDLTDVDGFRAVRRLRDEGKLAGLNVAVIAAETLPEVLAASDVTVPGVPACTALLTALAEALAADARDAAAPQ